MRAVLNDLRALGQMLEQGTFERGVTRIGSEQELFLVNRAYDPATGRFLSRDPAHDPANLGNPYTYVGNNPGAFVDPFGLSMERIGEQGWWGTFFGALFGSGGAPAPARAPDNAT